MHDIKSAIQGFYYGHPKTFHTATVGNHGTVNVNNNKVSISVSDKIDYDKPSTLV